MTTLTWLAALAEIYPPDRLLTQPAQVTPYESDALTAYRQRPAAVVIPETANEVIAAVRLCYRFGVPFVAPRQRHQPVRRLAADRGWPPHHVESPQPHRTARSGGAHRSGRAGRDQPRRDACRVPVQLLLCARPFQPGGMHHRRQYRLQLRRRALLKVRHDQQPRARHQGRAAGRRGGARSAARARRRWVRTWSGCTSGPRGSSVWRWRSLCA